MAAKPKPTPEYKTLKQAFQTKGMQPGEKEAIAKIAKHRGVSTKEARAIGKRRTANGLSTAGVAGPKGTPRWDKKHQLQAGGGAPEIEGRTGNTGPFPNRKGPKTQKRTTRKGKGGRTAT